MINTSKDAEGEDLVKAAAGFTKAMQEIRDERFLLDTSILITMCDGLAVQKKGLAALAAQNRPFICDTIAWEFIRHCGADTYRHRIGFLGEKGLLNYLHETAAVQKKYRAVWMTYLCAFKADPMRMIRLVIPDLWIVAAAVEHKVDTILTTDHSGDFPPELFDEKKYYIGRGRTWP